jgi:NDP-sugar pyrophosphorylase family protein
MFESVILIGPGTNLFPITNSSLKITNLPIINTELLLLNIKFLQPVSEKIYIVLLQKDVHYITHLINLANVPIEIIGIDYFDGSVQQLIKLEKRVQTKNLIVTKGDLVSNCDIKTIADDFILENSQFMTVLSKGENGATIGFRDQNLLYYSREENYILPNELFLKDRVTITKEYDSVQFYMFKKEIYNFLGSDMFSFKSNLLPKIVERLRNVCPVRIFNPMNTYIHQIRDASSYIKVLNLIKLKTHSDSDELIYSKDNYKIIKQYIKKKKLEDIKNLIGGDLECGDAVVVNSILGNNCIIGDKSQILSSIIMNNVVIGENCVIEKCLVGNNVTIPDNTNLVKCMISPSYVFVKSVTTENNTFSCN